MRKFSGCWNDINDYRKQLEKCNKFQERHNNNSFHSNKKMQASVFSNAEQWKCFILLIPKSAQMQIVGTIIQHFG